MKKVFFYALVLAMALALVPDLPVNFKNDSSTKNVYTSKKVKVSTTTKPQPEIINTSEQAPKVVRQPKRYANPMPFPPDVIKAIYFTSGSVANINKLGYLINIAKNTDINAVVIDINGFSGYIAYDTKDPELLKHDTKDINIIDLASVVERLHAEGIYVIARITVFQDLAFAGVRPDLAVKSDSNQDIWIDNSNQAWLDPASKEVWDYKVLLAKDVLRYGVDELNFDYIRFPSDGDLQDTKFPFWDEKTSRSEIISDFFAYLRQELPSATLSVDLFGLTSINRDDLGIGQIIEDAYDYFDVVSPMVYPSHYADGYLGFQKPAEHPYEVVAISLANAMVRLKSKELTAISLGESLNRKVSIRPWLQDFDLGSSYDAEKVRAQIEATKNMLGSEYGGFMVWSPTNIYTLEALSSEN